MSVGPHIPWPMKKGAERLLKTPSSCDQMTRWIGERSAPPYSFGQWGVAHPASLFFFCQALAAFIGSTLLRASRVAPGRATARTAGQLMSAPAVSATADLSVGRAADLMQARHLKRLPVVDADRHLLGIVARSDLLEMFLEAPGTGASGGAGAG